MDLFGRHKISYESIRRLAIECHALDTAAVDLLVDTTIDKPEVVRATYEELFSEKLLALAISLRTKFYQGVPIESTERFVSHAGLLFFSENAQEKPMSFTIKDVCDKVIHANSVIRPMDDGTHQPVTQIRGAHHGTPWELHISTSLFCAGVLNWLEALNSEG